MIYSVINLSLLSDSNLVRLLLNFSHFFSLNVYNACNYDDYRKDLVNIEKSDRHIEFHKFEQP